MTDPALSLQQLGLTVERGRWLLRDLTMELNPGTVTAIVGPNGAGKTTLARTLVGLRPPSAGEICLGGTPLRALGLGHRARAIAYLPQTTPLYHDLCVEELVLLGRAPALRRFGPPTAHDLERAREALAWVGVAGLAQRSVFSLSGGEYQRVSLARLVAGDAPILVLDEPVAGLDIGHALEFLTLCRKLAREQHTVVLAMHELELARRYADHALCLHRDGRGTFAWGAAEEVLVPAILDGVFGVQSAVDRGRLWFEAR